MLIRPLTLLFLLPFTLAQAPAPSSPTEQLTRTLLQLKSQRADIANIAPHDPQLAQLDAQISTLRQQLAPTSNLHPPSPQSPPTQPPTYPRIVPPTPIDETPTSTASPSPHSFAIPAAAPSSSDSPATTSARKALLQPIDIPPSQKTLADTLDSLAAQTHTNFYINWPALQTAGVDRTSPITLNLSAIPASRALRIILQSVGGGTANLHFTIDEGIIIVSTAEDLSSAKYQSVRVYNVRDLLSFNAAAYPPQIANAISENRANALMDTIRSVVAPDSWREAGGNVGSIRELDGLLIINQLADNHAATDALLAKLRAAH